MAERARRSSSKYDDTRRADKLPARVLKLDERKIQKISIVDLVARVVVD